MSLESEHTPQSLLDDDNVKQMLMLAERLRESHGGELDDSAILAVSEATGAPPDYVRLAIRLLPEKKTKRGMLHQVRAAFLTLEPDVRRYVSTGFFATFCAAMAVLSSLGPRFSSGEGLFGTLMLVSLGVALWNISLAKESRVAAMAGALFGGVFFVAQSLFDFLLNSPLSIPSLLLLPHIVGGALAGFLIQAIVTRYRSKLGIADPVQERQELLRQLVQLQDKLKSGEQSMTFLSIDIVGSTRMKEQADSLSIEFTFTEYHNFVDMVTRKYQGNVHSTAGDGITCAFEHPQQAFAAARNIQTGIIELNTFRNKTGIPIVLRCGIHTGSVVAPKAGDIKSVNFAHVIDIAAHLQKVCPPGGIAVSDTSCAYIAGGSSTIGSTRVSAMDISATVWQPRQFAAPAFDVPPPAPNV